MSEEQRQPPTFQLPPEAWGADFSNMQGPRVPVNFIGEKTFGNNFILHEAQSFGEVGEADSDYQDEGIMDEALAAGHNFVEDPRLDSPEEIGQLFRVRVLSGVGESGMITPAVAQDAELLPEAEAQSFRQRREARLEAEARESWQKFQDKLAADRAREQREWEEAKIRWAKEKEQWERDSRAFDEKMERLKNGGKPSSPFKDRAMEAFKQNQR